eukprot:Hpha_TRINITY_DN12582_c0_g1::TRINITY_DN12582_c0_g1_i1::g.50959::m.50959
MEQERDAIDIKNFSFSLLPCLFSEECQLSMVMAPGNTVLEDINPPLPVFFANQCPHASLALEACENAVFPSVDRQPLDCGTDVSPVQLGTKLQPRRYCAVQRFS